MNKPLLYIALGLTAVSLSYAQSGALLTQAQENANAMIAGDYPKSVDYMYAPIVAQMGGKDAAIEFVRQSMQKMKAQGSEILAIEVGSPSQIVREGAEDVAIVPVTMGMRFQEKKVRVDSYLVAISPAGTSKWAFMDGAQLPKEKIQSVFPTLASKVTIPERRNSLEEDIQDTLKQIEQKEGKPINQVLQEKRAESKRLIALIDSNGLRSQIESAQGAKLEKIPTVTLKEIMKAKGYE